MYKFVKYLKIGQRYTVDSTRYIYTSCFKRNTYFIFKI